VAPSRLSVAGLAGAGVVSALAAWTAVNRAVVHRLTRPGDPVDPDDLELPADVVEHTVTMSDGWVVRVVERGPGDGPPVVLLHGITLGAAIWPYQLAALADAGLRVLAVDLRGHGHSGGAVAGGGTGTGGGAVPPAPTMTLDRMAADVADVLDFLDLTGVTLVGHSMGGMVALRLLTADPATAEGDGRLSSLVLAATTANATRRRGLPGLSDVVAATQPLVASASGLAARLPGPTLPANDLAFLLARVTFGEHSSHRQVAFTGQLTSEVPVRVSAELMLEIVRFNAEEILPFIRLPTTVVVGDHDLITPPAQSEYLAACIAGAELVVLEGCGHMLMLERPAELDRVIAWTDTGARTGCTVVLLPAGTTASGEVRGGAPGTREWALLDPRRTVDRVDAVVLSGGSAFGLAACEGVVRWCEERGLGWPTAAGPVPIVVGLVIYDLGVGDPKVRPGAEQGYAACVAARAGPEVEGRGPIGAGTGATVAKWRGPGSARPGGIGSAVIRHGGVTVAALMVINALGEAAGPPGGPPRIWEPATAPASVAAGEATTIGVIVTDGRLDKSGCRLVAEAGHDGLARALDPVHTAADGDAIVAAATGQVDAPPHLVRGLAARVVADAVADAVGN
jgi:L-aminopeptidase/D-esterase-like protein/pimeloyl-ACP methyl ester carboxylesterase